MIGNLGGSRIANIAAISAEPSAEIAQKLPNCTCEIAEIAESSESKGRV